MAEFAVTAFNNAVDRAPLNNLKLRLFLGFVLQRPFLLRVFALDLRLLGRRTMAVTRFLFGLRMLRGLLPVVVDFLVRINYAHEMIIPMALVMSQIIPRGQNISTHIYPASPN